ncbi:MAG: bifunctional D-glycero-beta-D-manno-heptose-7-phosphate kinase/D-glycero-beta-D-manno-heptose 1-phosphate adenylyltransferase HldE [Thiocapsa sp.]|nr:bifunctional D-glycero-beta-D-manno-heptose-7-phosphate kinase/D-glycero-beta-D-manno-heptose 1-phosphate adenylyltransferase HldE [Thiocapsa sp.]MCG6896713.1 bifunctional D-glycero-beta-D-manno-heptose-7-phosphate kinase/D-glycero-beta-D-manno-heptose 1-phosphate adenylyltransferase HldE [Thiocapsa sp.]MCG6984784.1 bifunctional D-glycero-beta-D-manno-heptose-7-phosphate kinase/D-glycero-beta-D-manno-heptose 1-phosphate adenylyltransferase HldE [Thiocapsa sp.]
MSLVTAPPFPDFSRARVLVAGDLMLDRYWSGSTRRISPEAPVPVVHVGQVEDRPGGAANVALNLATLGCQVTLVGVTGDDAAADILTDQLAAQGIRILLHRRADLPTITKLRVLSHHQQLIRLDFEQSLAPLGEDPLPTMLANALHESDLLVLSDYAKGTLVDPRRLIAMARELGKRVLVDPKGSEFARYQGASLLTPNRGELEAIVGVCADDATLVGRGERLRAELGLDALLVTLGERGMLLLRPSADALHLPTRAHEVFDVTGAGDTVIATLAAALGAGVELSESCTLANCAAGLAVGKLGAAAVTARELKRAYLGAEWHTLLDQEALLDAVAAARAAGERIVMTNGCFDILHEGHVAYLQQARRLGDRLIVAVNDDASVRRLKGPDRPVNGVEQRMAVLAGLASVDWVCAFSGDTPEALICRVRPDLLVKGGDYRAEEIAGAECVRKNGGEVRILDLLPGRSTTRILGAIRGG